MRKNLQLVEVLQAYPDTWFRVRDKTIPARIILSGYGVDILKVIGSSMENKRVFKTKKDLDSKKIEVYISAR